MAFLLDKDCLEATLKEMPDSFVLTVELLCVNPIEKLHPTLQISPRCFYEQVVVIAHQAVRMTDPTVPRNYVTEKL